MQEAFAQHYAVHRKPSAAYRAAYSFENMTPQTIAVNAQTVKNNTNVALRIYELQTVAENAFKVTVEEKKQWLKQIIEMSLQVGEKNGVKVFIGDEKAATQAISELNKMDGHLAASKKEISGVIGINIDEDDSDL